MGKTVAVSFEESHIKIVQASITANSCSVERAEIVEYDEFDTYLQNEKASKFIVTYDFKEAYHGFLTVPILKPRYQQTIIASELRKTSKLSHLSYVYVPIEERLVEKKKVLEIFYFAVNNEVIQDVAGKFYDCDKVVKAIQPTVFSASSLIRPRKPGEANMGIFGTGQEKIVFYAKDKGVTFIRNYESLDTELSDFDIQNINMTISYCWQNIRVNPSSVMLMGNLSSACTIRTMPTAPLACLYKDDKIACSSEQFNEFFLPIASLFAPGSSNILSKDFRNINTLKSYMGYAAKVCVALSLLSLLFLLYQGNEALSLRHKIEAAMSEGSDVETIYSEYEKKQEDMQSITPVIEFLNRPSPDLLKFLTDIADMTQENIWITSVKAGAKDGRNYAVTIQGMGRVETYSSLQTAFSALIDRIKMIQDVKVNTTSVNLQDKTFKIDLNYHRTG